MLQPWDAFVLSSDLEGLLLDVVGQEKLARMLGPDETAEVSKETAEDFATGASGREAMAAHLGAKGWNSDRKKSGKAKPHVPSALLRQHLGSTSGQHRAIKPLTKWLSGIVDAHKRAPL